MEIDVETDEIVKEFLVESSENLDQLDRDLVMLEEDPSNGPVLASVFRTIHTIKGTCGFLGYGKLESVSHVAESLLSRLRDATLTLTPEITSALLATTDAIREVLASIESQRTEGDGDYSALVATLTALQTPLVQRDDGARRRAGHRRLHGRAERGRGAPAAVAEGLRGPDRDRAAHATRVHELKALLPEPCVLSLPRITTPEEASRRPGSMIAEATFQCSGEPFVVRVYEEVAAEALL